MGHEGLQRFMGSCLHGGRRLWIGAAAGAFLPSAACTGSGGGRADRGRCVFAAVIVIGKGWVSVRMKIVVVKSPRFLAGLLRMFFKIEKEQG